MSGLLSQFRQAISKDKLLQKQYFSIQFLADSNAGGDKVDGSAKDLFKSFNIYAQSASVPGKNLTTLEVKKHAFSLKMPDQVTFDGTWSVNVLLNLSLSYYKRLLEWQAQYSSLECDMGGIRGFPGVKAGVQILNNLFKADKTAGKITMYGIFPTKVPQIDLSQEESAYLTPTVEFAYSYHDDFTDKDPISNPGNSHEVTTRSDLGDLVDEQSWT